MRADKKKGRLSTVKCSIVISPQLMKAMLLMFKRQVEQYEQTNGGITLPTDVLHRLGEEIG